MTIPSVETTRKPSNGQQQRNDGNREIFPHSNNVADDNDSTTKGTRLSDCDTLRPSNTNGRDLEAPPVDRYRYNGQVDICCCGCVKTLYFDESDVWEWDYLICGVMTCPGSCPFVLLFMLLPALAILGLVLTVVGAAIRVMELWLPGVVLLAVPCGIYFTWWLCQVLVKLRRRWCPWYDN